MRKSMFSFFPAEQTFDAKLLHIESRPGRNSKNGTSDLEFFMRCDVHASDVDVFIDSLKSIMEDVRSVPEEKGEGRRPPVMHVHANGTILTEALFQVPGFHDN